MNEIDRLFLKFFLLPERLYAKQGVDILHLRAILTAKLTMDNRRVNTLMAQRQKKTPKQTKPQYATLNTMLMSFIMGFFLIFAFYVGTDTLTKLTMFTTMFIFMLCMMLITDFTHVLIDTRDNLILLPKPVSDKTFLFARLLHIGIRLSLLVLPMAIPGLFAVVHREGLLVVLPYFLVVLLMTIFSIFLINALYLLILKLTTPEKFKSIITAIQIVFVVLLLTSYQIFPRLMMSDTFKNTNLSDFFWIRFYPPFWFSEACLYLSGVLTGSQSVVGLILALVVPLVSIWVVVRFLAPAFTQKLSLISGGVEEKSTATVSSKIKGLRLKELFCALLARRGTEKAGFLFAWDMMARSKDFKMKVLPQYGYVIVMGVVFYLQHHFPIEGFAILMIYVSSTLMTTALTHLAYSERFKAAWLFHVTPIAAPGQLIGGSIKAIFTMFYLPVIVLLLVMWMFLMGPNDLLSIGMGVLNVLTISLFQAYLNNHYLPFSKQLDGVANGTGFVRTLFYLLPLIGFGFLHFYIRKMPWVMGGVSILSIASSWLLFREISKLKWSDMKD